MIGGHFIICWARAQNHVNPFSAEADQVALVKCFAELLGIRIMVTYFGIESGVIVYADSSAALATAKRKGAGNLRHTNINCLWIQENRIPSSLNSAECWPPKTQPIL